ncbi:hypothetical protein BWI17_10405 [Betaproteobacteria bacterium GR16-43]|nr:hypothetical protein BWI17_10405 [Betaproteobacteria bacterium GR16-43]
MKSPMLNVLLPLALLAATAVPADPARAEGPVCKKVSVPAKDAKASKATAAQAGITLKEVPKLEAL